ncbi:MAG: hypothetical protein ABIF08_04525 [Nanoarchaeota archaeon]
MSEYDKRFDEILALPTEGLDFNILEPRRNYLEGKISDYHTKACTGADHVPDDDIIEIANELVFLYRVSMSIAICRPTGKPVRYLIDDCNNHRKTLGDILGVDYIKFSYESVGSDKDSDCRCLDFDEDVFLKVKEYIEKLNENIKYGFGIPNQ